MSRESEALGADERRRRRTRVGIALVPVGVGVDLIATSLARGQVPGWTIGVLFAFGFACLITAIVLLVAALTAS